MSFQTGLSGLNASSKDLDVIGHNVANSGTVGFKASKAQFADVFATSLAGGGGSQIGIGVKLANVAQQFTQGNITATNNPLDMAINGGGFFRLSDAGSISYTRNGQFELDKSNYVVSNSGLRLTGYQADSAGAITGALGDIQLNTAAIPPTITSTINIGTNLDSGSVAPIAPLTAVPLSGTAPNFNAPNPSSYNSSTSLTIYDSLGNSHAATIYFVKQPPPAVPPVPPVSEWKAFMTVDNGAKNGGVVTDLTSAGNLIFNASGTLTGPVGPPVGTLPVNNITWNAALNLGIASPQPLTFNFNGSTQYGSDFGVSSMSQNGYTSGNMAGFSISGDGTIQGRYTNGQNRTLGRVALANFTNPQGLQQLGENQWAESAASGSPLTGAPGSASLGVLQSSSTEDSNVDLTAELVNMIVAQRAYQANAQTIKTQDAVQQTLINLR